MIAPLPAPPLIYYTTHARPLHVRRALSSDAFQSRQRQGSCRIILLTTCKEASSREFVPCLPLTPARAHNIQGARCLIRVRAAGQSQRKFEVSFSILVVSASQTQAPARDDGNVSLAAVLGVFFGVEESEVVLSQTGTRRVLVTRGSRRQRAEVDASAQLQDDRDAFVAQIAETHAALVAYLGVPCCCPCSSLCLSWSVRERGCEV